VLKYRLIFGPIMLLAAFGAFWLDARLDQLDTRGTVLDDWFGREYLPAGLVLLGLAAVIILIAARELRTMFAAKGVDASYAVLAGSGLAGCLLMFTVPHGLSAPAAIAIFATVVVGVFIVSLLRHSWGHRTEGAIAAAAAASFTLIYLGALPGFYLAIRRWHTAWVILGILVVVKSCDIGAYAAGRLFGRHKLIPWLSPGKTWEGLVGGMLFSATVAVGFTALGNATGTLGYWLRPGINDAVATRTFVEQRYSLLFAAWAGVLLGLVGQFGDLVASLLKRDAGVKDSGGSIPGFGGIVDVVDSPIVVAPLAYWLLYFAAQTQ